MPTAPATPIRLAVVDDHPAIVRALGAAALEAGDVRLVATARTPEEAERLLAGAAADGSLDVVLCDLQLAGETEGLRLVERHGGGTRPAIIVLSAYDYPAVIRAAFERGAAGYVLKTAEPDEILDAVRAVAAGGTAFTAEALRLVRLAPRAPSERELDVLDLLVRGASNDEISAALSISLKTVESHFRRLFGRYGVLSRTELAVLALREGWLATRPEAGR